MSEIERGFATLLAAVKRVELPSAMALRARADRRTRRNLAAAAAAILALLATATAGARELVGAPEHREPASPTPSMSPPIIELPTTWIPGPPGCVDVEVNVHSELVGGAPLDPSLMLEPADWGGECFVVTRDIVGYSMSRDPKPIQWPRPPAWCEALAGSDSEVHRSAGRSRGFLGRARNIDVDGITIDGFESVTRYEPGWAGIFLNEVRNRVRLCPTFVAPLAPGLDIPWQSMIVATEVAGEESLVMYVGYSAEPEVPWYPAYYAAVVRVGDLVAVVEPLWFGRGIPKAALLDYTVELATKAADKLYPPGGSRPAG